MTKSTGLPLTMKNVENQNQKNEENGENYETLAEKQVRVVAETVSTELEELSSEYYSTDEENDDRGKLSGHFNPSVPAARN